MTGAKVQRHHHPLIDVAWNVFSEPTHSSCGTRMVPMHLMSVSGCCAGSIMKRACCTMREPCLSVSNSTLQ